MGIYYWNNGSPELMLFLRSEGNWPSSAPLPTGPLAAGHPVGAPRRRLRDPFLQNGVPVISATDTTLIRRGAGHHGQRQLATAGNWSGGTATAGTGGFQVQYQSTDANGVESYQRHLRQ